MHIALLGTPRSWYCRELQRAATERGHRQSLVDFRRLVASVGCDAPILAAEWPGLDRREAPVVDAPPAGGPGLRKASSPGHPTAGDLDLTKVDAVVVRTMPPGSLEQVVFRMDALARLEAAGVSVLNPPKAIECAVDKYLTTARLAAAGLKVPATVVCENSEAALAAFDRLGGDVVVKPVFGSEGRGILRVSDPDLALRTFRTLERINAVLYLQRYVDHAGADVRVLILDGRVLGAIARHGDGDFRTNVSRNGRAEPHALTDEEQAMALKASAVVGARFAGVDLLYDRAGTCYVIEVNAVPGWRAFQRITNCDVAAEVIRSLERNEQPSPPSIEHRANL